jgi:hypothetical protein
MKFKRESSEYLYIIGKQGKTKETSDLGSTVVSNQGNDVVQQQIPVVFDQITRWVDVIKDWATEQLESIKCDIPHKPAST